MTRLLVSSGEPSGELYGAELVRHLRPLTPDLEVFGLGGDRLQAQGARLVAHVRELAVVGLTEVVRHLRRLRRVFRTLLQEIDGNPPALAVLIDYPDFNLRLARELKRRGIPVVYYVSPQIWAWRTGRIKTIRATVDRMLVIFPFEQPLYENAGVPVEFVGHPLIDLIPATPDRAGYQQSQAVDPTRPLIALLPGSRPSEITHNLPPLVAAVQLLHAARPELQFHLAQAPSLDPALLRARLGNRTLQIRLVPNDTPRMLGAADVALVASGTATVETALAGTPLVVVYRVSPLTYLLGRRLLRIEHFAMVNLIAGRRVVTELEQAAFTPEAVAHEAGLLLDDRERAARMRQDLAEVRRKLGAPGASQRAARAVHALLQDPRT